MSDTGIDSFFRGRSVLVTGASGYMGKVLVEKLLRTCTQLATVYVLLRPKSERDAGRRLNDLLHSKIFDRLKEQRPAALAKLVAIGGDIELDGLGLTEADDQLLTANVSVVFHAAATIKFDEGLRRSVDINVTGTRRVCDLCSRMRNLVALIYVSTAYCNCDRDEIDEVVYPLPCHPDKVIDALEWMDDEAIAAITPYLVGGRPNTYTYTKAMAEQLLAHKYGSLPIAIVRPSMVLSSWKEPFPGWIENLNGPTGYVIGYGKGVIRNVFCHEEMFADFVPVDAAISLVIAAAWYTATHKPNNLLVYNCTSGNLNRLTWGKFQDCLTRHMLRDPVSGVVWYPSMMVCRSRFTSDLASKLICIFPGYFLDTIARLTGKKPLMVRVQERFQKVFTSLEYFTNHEWQFASDNVLMLMEAMTPLDRQDFDFDLRRIDWLQYLDNYFIGVKTFILKEDPSALPAARRHLLKMYVIFHLTHILGFVVAWRLLMTRFASARCLWYSTLSVVFRLLRLITAIQV